MLSELEQLEQMLFELALTQSPKATVFLTLLQHIWTKTQSC